jgi:hypothetical protein
MESVECGSTLIVFIIHAPIKDAKLKSQKSANEWGELIRTGRGRKKVLKVSSSSIQPELVNNTTCRLVGWRVTVKSR